MIVGDGPLFGKLNEIENSQDDTIILTGKLISEIPNYLAMADICLLISENNEIMNNIVPIKYYEYLASEKPIISTGFNGVKRILRGKRYFTLMIGRIFEAIENIEDVLDGGKYAFQMVKNYDWENILRKFCDTIL